MEYPDLLNAWDAFKVFLRGIFLAEVNAIKQKTKAQSEQATWLVCHLEALPTRRLPPGKAWMATYATVDHLAAFTMDRKRSFNKLAFEEEEQMGRLLAKIVQAHQTSPVYWGTTHPGGKGGVYPDI